MGHHPIGHHRVTEIVLKSYRLDPGLDALPTLNDLMDVAKVMKYNPNEIIIRYPECGLHTIELVVFDPQPRKR